MLGLTVIALAIFMIYTLVRNALAGTQLSISESFNGNIELLIPISNHSQFHLQPWAKAISTLHSLQGKLKIHILIDGHHPSIISWQEMKQSLNFMEIHHFSMRPSHTQASTWLIEQMIPHITSDIVIIGDPELVPDEHIFTSLARLISDKQRPYFVLPQTAHINALTEAIAVLNPTLAMASVFGLKKYRRNISHPMMSIAQGWIGMSLHHFKSLNFTDSKNPSWKLYILRKWEKNNISYRLAFGEKHLIRYYPSDVKSFIQYLKSYWEELWAQGNRAGFWLYTATLFIWAFPVLCFATHPYWSIATIFLLLIYRFFTKIIFQESWMSVLLHPFGCIVWAGTFFWWASSGLKSRYKTQGHLSN